MRISEGVAELRFRSHGNQPHHLSVIGVLACPLFGLSEYLSIREEAPRSCRKAVFERFGFAEGHSDSENEAGLSIMQEHHPTSETCTSAIQERRGVDFIGDIHGHASQLRTLLGRLGYRTKDGVFTHPERRVVFLGDYVDRGPEIRQTLEIVRTMVEAGNATALMGNHEYNAIAWFTPRPDRPKEPCRRHTEIRRRLIAPTLDALGDELEDWLEWMSDLPLWFESTHARAVHASWDPSSVRFLRDLLDGSNHGLNRSRMQATCKPGSTASHAVHQLLKGREIPLPPGVSLRDPEGSPRGHIRARWFESPVGRTYRDYAFTRDDAFPDEPIPAEAVPTDFVPYGASEPPVFVGHYWMRGDRPSRLAHNVACLDWSVARGGPVVAYRFDGESEIDDAKFVTA